MRGWRVSNRPVADRHFTLTSFLKLRTHFGCRVVNTWDQAV
jgi:hypothetical protein